MAVDGDAMMILLLVTSMWSKLQLLNMEYVIIIKLNNKFKI